MKNVQYKFNRFKKANPSG